MGQQVADNKELQSVIKMVRHPVTDKLYFEDKPRGYGLIRNEYVPIAGMMIYPRKWGKEKAIKHMLDYLIKDQETIIRNAESYINELNDIAY